MPKLTKILMVAATAAVVGQWRFGTTTRGAEPQLDRAMLDKYCVTCHNERLKTAGLALDKVDVGNVPANVEVLEKVVRKLRSGLMPPEGQPRPDKAVLDSFVTTLETALDRN